MGVVTRKLRAQVTTLNAMYYGKVIVMGMAPNPAVRNVVMTTLPNSEISLNIKARDEDVIPSGQG